MKMGRKVNVSRKQPGHFTDPPGIHSVRGPGAILRAESRLVSILFVVYSRRIPLARMLAALLLSSL